MKIIDIIKSERPSLSMEVFPPKTSDSLLSVKIAPEKIAVLNPDFMSVTYGAGGGTSQFTADIAGNLQDKYDVPVVAHLTCVSSTKDTVHKRIEDIKNVSGIGEAAFEKIKEHITI